MKTKVIITCVLIFLFLASAIASAGLGVSGAIIERNVDPGETFVHEMTVSSDSASPPMDLVVDILGLNQSIDGENTELTKEEDTGPYSARALLRATPESFHLEPGESQNVLVEGKIPADASPGGRYAMINVHSLPIGNGTIGIVVAVEVPVRLIVSGSGLTKTGGIEDLKLEKPISAKRQNVSLLLKNTGNCHFKARADAVLKDKEGNVVASASTPLSTNIIPDASRLFQISVVPGKALKPGSYVMNSTVRLDNGSALATEETQLKI